MRHIEYPRPTRILNSTNLRSTWLNSKDSRGQGGAPGIDGITATSFGSNLAKNVDRIVSELSLGEFHFAKLRPSPIPKGEGKFRIICVPTIRDRLVQRTILHYLTYEKDLLGVLSPNSFGVIKGKEQGTHRAIETAIKRRQKNSFVLKTDISKFFDNIPRDYLLLKIQSRLRKRSVVPLLEQIVATEITSKNSEVRAKISAAGITEGKGLRQGMPLSPLLSNLVLRQFDKKLSDLGKSFIRYVDDLAVFEESEADCLRTRDVIESELDKLGLEIPQLGVEKSKTEIKGPTDEVIFLGLAIYRQKNGHYAKRIPQFAFDDLRERLNTEVSFADFEAKGSKSSKNMKAYLLWFEGLRAGYGAAYSGATNLPHFQVQVDNLVQESKMKLLKEVFGEHVVRDLDDRKMRFLGLA